MRKKVYDILEMTDPNDFVSKLFSIFIVSLILINVICIVLESINEINIQYRTTFLVIEIISTMIFATEYCLRLWSCQNQYASNRPFKTRIQYIETVSNR